MDPYNMKLESVYVKGKDGEFHLHARRDECATKATAEKEYIEKETVIDTLCGHFIPNRHQYIEEIRALPAENVRPVVRGEWEEVDRTPLFDGMEEHLTYRCSSCRAYQFYDVFDNGTARYNFCPNCGAEMEGQR